jgi:pyruvate-formate lyase
MTALTDLDARIAALRVDAMSRAGAFLSEMNPCTRDVALWRALGERRSRVQVRARLLRELVALAPVEIPPEWGLAGEHLAPSVGGFGLALQGTPSAEQREQLASLGLDAEEMAAAAAAVQTWSASGEPFVETGDTTADLAAGHGQWAAETPTRTVFWASGWMENHSIRDFALVLRSGFAGIAADIRSRLSKADMTDPDFPQKENFWRAALDICEAGVLLGKRYASRARELAAAAESPEERQRLEQMADCCERVPAHGARTLTEAVQSLWLAHVLTCGEDGINANSIGRLDQIMYPYYAADTAAGRITREGAAELMQELACKLYLEYDVQAIVLGGKTRDGSDAVNELSHIILEATRDLGFVRDLSVRLHRQTPDAFVDLAASLMARGGGIPFIFNDECFIPALAGHGISMEDARDYAPVGCIELTVPGKANPHAVSGWFNGLKCLELALFGGLDPLSGRALGPEDVPLTAMDSFDQVLAAYRKQVQYFAERMVYHCNRGELQQRERGPLPCWSTLTDACIERGRDITNGGPLYNYHSICFLGTANLADALVAIKQLVFDSGRVSPEELLEALRTDFKGHEPLRQLLLHQPPKYGNDVPEVDAYGRLVTSEFIDLMDRMRSPLGGRYHVHLFSFHAHLTFGKGVGATPDGRCALEPLAYSLAAHQGRDESGVTALLNTLAQMPHERAAGATAAIVDVDPAAVSGPGGVQRLVQLIRAAVDMGVGQLQWNVTTAARLRQAQEDPERYGNIAVRVAGYSQMFKLINRELQDHIIARTKHRS